MLETLVGERYRVIAELGSGATATVYEACDAHSGELVAIKIMHQAEVGTRTAVERFEQQRRAAKAVAHPGVVRILSWGTQHGRPYLAMERLRGKTLAALIRDPADTAAELVLQIGIELCEVAAAAHKKGIIHRDLKPQNVILCEDGRRGHAVKVLDFGAAKLAESVEALTRSREFLGTLAYAPPEQLRDAKRVDARSDIYAVGCILYELLAKQRPFVETSKAGLILAILNDTPEPLSELCRDVPETLAGIVERCLAKSPAARFPNALLLARELRSCPL